MKKTKHRSNYNVSNLKTKIRNVRDKSHYDFSDLRESQMAYIAELVAYQSIVQKSAHLATIKIVAKIGETKIINPNKKLMSLSCET